MPGKLSGHSSQRFPLRWWLWKQAAVLLGHSSLRFPLPCWLWKQAAPARSRLLLLQRGSALLPLW